jgi:hypothetical protein
MTSHGEQIKLVLCQLITWTLFKDEITLVELFGGIGTGLETLMQSRMVVQRYFYVDIGRIINQVAASRMMELTTKFSTTICNHHMEGQFHFLPFDIQLIQNKHMELLSPMDLIISGWECQRFLKV